MHEEQFPDVCRDDLLLGTSAWIDLLIYFALLCPRINTSVIKAHSSYININMYFIILQSSEMVRISGLLRSHCCVWILKAASLLMLLQVADIRSRPPDTCLSIWPRGGGGGGGGWYTHFQQPCTAHLALSATSLSSLSVFSVMSTAGLLTTGPERAPSIPQPTALSLITHLM